MTRLTTDRRAILMAAGSAALAAATGAVAAQAADIQGMIRFEGGAAIPEGRIEVFLTDPATHDATHDAGHTQPAKARLASDGGLKAVEFSLPAGDATPTPQRIVAQLLREEDGWLLARGSADVKDGHAVTITLYTVMY